MPFTGAQAAALEAAYARAPYLAPPALRALAAALQLREDRVSTNKCIADVDRYNISAGSAEALEDN